MPRELQNNRSHRTSKQEEGDLLGGIGLCDDRGCDNYSSVVAIWKPRLGEFPSYGEGLRPRRAS